MDFYISLLKEAIFETPALGYESLLSFEFARRSLIASLYTEAFLTPGGWQCYLKCVFWKFLVGLKCVDKYRMLFHIYVYINKTLCLRMFLRSPRVQP